jgi:predicted porin
MNHRCTLLLARLSALIGCAAALDASAQSVTLYGIIDVGVERLSNVGAAGHSLRRIPSLTASVPSRWGVRGRDDLGGGLNAEFVLESGFAPDTGTLGQGGRGFGRQAYVGLFGSWGQLSIGRQYTMLGTSLADADVLGPNIYGHASFDAYLPNARADNSVVYRGRFGGFSGGALYSFGRDTVNAGPGPSGSNCAGEIAGDSKACRAMSAIVKYDAAQWGAAVAVDRINGGTGAFAGLTSSALTDTRTVVSGYAKFAGAKLGAYLLQRNNQGSAATPRSKLYFVGASYPVTPLATVDAAVFRYDLENSDNDARMLVLRGTYHLSKRTAVYAQAGRMSNQGASAISASVGGAAPAPGQSQTGLMSGLRHVF